MSYFRWKLKRKMAAHEVEDNIREWTGLEFAKSQREVENRGKWRKLVVNIISGAPTTLAVKG